MSQGIVQFKSVPEAMRAGYEVLFPPTPDENGMLVVRIKTAAGWAKAIARVGE